MASEKPKINRDAMRTTLWQILVSSFVAAYVTFYVTLTFSANPISGWAAAPLAFVLSLLLAAMILVLFLATIRLSPKEVFRLTDAIIDWSLQKPKK